MAMMKLSGLQKTGKFVSADMFGANAVFSNTDDGAPTRAFEDAADALGIQFVRFGGGQADLDPNKANAAGERPVDGVSAINIVEMNGSSLRPELVKFLDWAVASNAAGDPVKALLIIPTKHLSTAEYKAFAAQIETFVKTLMPQYGDVIGGFQIGNEFWEMGETAYGIKASLAVEALNVGLLASGISVAEQPDILVQMATAGNAGSEFPAIAGVNNFAARNEAANLQVIAQLSDKARAAIDGVTEHYYYNKSYHEFVEGSSAVKHIDKDYAIWSKAFDRELDLHITEWNVRAGAEEQHGIVAASTVIKQFENMIKIGADAAHVWTLDYHSRTALTLDTDNGVRLDDQGRLINSAQGAAFDLMSDALVGKERVAVSFSGGVPGIEVSAYSSAAEMVFYISSRSFEQTAFNLDLSAKLPAKAMVDAVKIAIDQSTSNGRQWEVGEKADSVMVNGRPYFYNEHDVDVVLTDMVFSDISQIDLMLNPFEVVQLTVDLTGTATPKGPANPNGIVTPVKNYYIGTDGDDLIARTDILSFVDAGAGIDTFFTDSNGVGSSIKIDGFGKPVLNTNDGLPNVTLANVERIVFQDGTLALNVEGNSGQAYRLYQASFDRTPDAAGLEFWIKQLDSGDLSLVEVASNFINSAEFSAAYGDSKTLADTKFVDLLYKNVLKRDADQEGYEFWLSQKAQDLSRQEMLVFFSESTENKSNVAPFIDDGIWLV